MNGQKTPKPDAAYLVIGLAATGLAATGLIASALSFGTLGWLAGR